MKQKDVDNLTVGEMVEHKHLGICEVKENMRALGGQFFGLRLQPTTVQGMINLMICLSVPHQFLEDSIRRVKPARQKDNNEDGQNNLQHAKQAIDKANG